MFLACVGVLMWVNLDQVQKMEWGKKHGNNYPPLENATNKEASWLYDSNESDVGWLAIGFWSVPEILPHFFSLS